MVGHLMEQEPRHGGKSSLPSSLIDAAADRGSPLLRHRRKSLSPDLRSTQTIPATLYKVKSNYTEICDKKQSFVKGGLGGSVG